LYFNIKILLGQFLGISSSAKLLLMKKACSVTSDEFEILPTHQEFYKRIGVPTPTICPDERLRRRNAHRNEHQLYRGKSALTGQPLIGLYSPDSWAIVYTQDEWWSDNWDALDHGRVFDLSQECFPQFHELQKVIPRTNVISIQNEDSEYASGIAYCRNCYLINSSENCQDCYYGKLYQRSSDIVDSAYVYDSELCYEVFQVEKAYNCKWVYYSQNVTDCWFGDDLRNCKNCFLCTNLVGKQYYFMNQPLSQTDYKSKVKEIIRNPVHLQEAKEKFDDFRKKRIYKYSNITNSENCTGDFISNAKNCQDCYDINDGEDCWYTRVGVGVKDLMDCDNHYVKSELCYETLGGLNTYNCHFCLYVFDSNDLIHCEQCFNCQDCFGCVGLRKQQYCIFNKKYSKKDYFSLRDQIIKKMKTTKEWGEFLPAKYSPFGYNDTVAQIYLPLNESEVLKQGWRWSPSIPITDVDKARTYDIPEKIMEVTDDILKAVLHCEATGKPYKIQKAELSFYRKMKLPIPKLCPDERYRRRLTLRPPRKLYPRQCAKTGAKVLSPFSPDRLEIIYSEAAYLEAVQ
jgi:hypothetical protein